MERGLRRLPGLALTAAVVLVLAACGGGGSESGFVATSGEHTCAVQQGGSLECWGFDTDGSVDDPNASSNIYGFPPALRSTAADAGGRLTNDQRAQIVNAADGIRAALGCA